MKNKDKKTKNKKMKQTKSKFYAISILALISIVGMIIASCAQQYYGCSTELKICPDGSHLGRSGPSCEMPLCPEEGKITNFEECTAAGYPVMESYPRQCSANGQIFVEKTTPICGNNICERGEAGECGECSDLTKPCPMMCSRGNCPQDCEETNGKMSPSFTKEIDTGKGTLFLTYGDGKTLLSGSLERSTPCVSWKITAISTKDMPTSNVNINIFDWSKDKKMMCAQVIAEPQEISEEITSTSEQTNYGIKFEDEILFEGKLGDSK